MARAGTDPEAFALRRLAADLADRRKERMTTGHLLAAIASERGDAARLLGERRLGADVLLKAARVLTDDASDAVERALGRARDFAKRSPAREALGSHLLFALCQERTTAAYRAMEQCGVDVGKLRASAMQLGLGVAGTPRLASESRTMEVAGAARSRPSEAPGRPNKPSSPTIGSRLSLPEVPRPVQQTPRVATPRPQQRETVRPGQRASKPTRLPRPERPSRPTSQRRPASRAARSGSHFGLDAKAYPTLAKIGRNLTELASMGELDPVCHREKEVERVLDVLAKRTANSPILVGAAGVGKSSVARAVAIELARTARESGDAPVLVEIEPSSVVLGTGVRGALAERLAQIRTEVMRAEGHVIVFFDEIHVLFGPDAGDEAAAELKGALARGELPCFGATSHEDYKKWIEPDAALARRFTVVEVDELPEAQAADAVRAQLPGFAEHHDVRYDEPVVDTTVEHCIRYVRGRALPDKALSILDLAGARVSRRGKRDVGVRDVAEIIADETQVPVERLLETDADRMLKLESLLAARVVGHEDSLARIASVLRRNASGIRGDRPIGTFLLLGPTGVGKTETAKAIAECLFHSQEAMTRLDFSEYAEAHAVARLVGAPPGYVGHESGGQLTEAVRKRPYQVLLLDEIEKAHRDVLESFLQVFDEGRLTDGRGKTVDFTNTVIVLTSNIGADALRRQSRRSGIGFASRRSAREVERAEREIKQLLIDSARSELPPELYNRIDDVLAFGPLGPEDVREIARRMLLGLGGQLEDKRGISLDFSDAAIEALLEGGGLDLELGARPMRRAIARLVEAPLSELLLRGEAEPGDVVLLGGDADAVTLDVVRRRGRAKTAS